MRYSLYMEAKQKQERMQGVHGGNVNYQDFGVRGSPLRRKSMEFPWSPENVWCSVGIPA